MSSDSEGVLMSIRRSGPPGTSMATDDDADADADDDDDDDDDCKYDSAPGDMGDRAPGLKLLLLLLLFGL
jgi:hypothetical protein